MPFWEMTLGNWILENHILGDDVRKSDFGRYYEKIGFWEDEFRKLDFG